MGGQTADGITLFLSIISMALCILTLILSWWLRLTPSPRLTIQKNRAATLFGSYLSFHLIPIVSNLGFTTLTMIMEAILIWSLTSHFIWTTLEGLLLYRSLVQKIPLQTSFIGTKWYCGVLVYVLPIPYIGLPFYLDEECRKIAETIATFVQDGIYSDQLPVETLKMYELFYLSQPILTVMLLINLCVLLMTIWNLSKRKFKEGQRHVSASEPSVLLQVMRILALCTILGLNWTAWLVTLFEPQAPILSIFIFSSGLIFFAQFVICNQSIWNSFKKQFRRLHSPEPKVNPEVTERLPLN